MAMIEKIRRQGWLVIVLVGIGIVGFLVPYDAVMAMFGNRNNSVGEIDGHDITAKEWQDAIKVQQELFRYDGNQAGLSNDTWNNLVESILMKPQYEDAGIQVTDEEYDEIVFGQFLSPYVLNTIYGGKDSTSLKEQMRTNFEGMPASMAEGWKNLITLKRQREKFDALVKKSLYANNIDGKFEFKATNDKVNVDYVVKMYASIPDSTIAWTESDLQSYYNKHKNDREYKQESSRSLEYIKFPVTPSAADSAAITSSLAEMKANFLAAKNDSAFAAANAATPGQGKVVYKEGQYIEPFNSQIKSDSVGRVVGPIVDNNTLRLVKITKRATEVDSVQARHILLAEKGAAGKAKADSIKAVIVKEKNFAAMAEKFGTDGTKTSGGDLGMFSRGAMVAPFEEACFNGKVGEVQIVETQFGVHVVEVTKKNAPKPVTYVSIVDRTIEPSPTTRKNAYSLVNEFTIACADSAAFRAAADTLNGGTVITPAKNIRPNATAVPGLPNSDGLISWAFGAEIGEVSPPTLVGNDYVVAVLTDIRERGVPTLQNIYDQVKEEVIKEKKAEKYMELMKQGSLQDIAKAVESDVKQGTNIVMKSANIPGSGVSAAENEIIGACFGLKKDFLSSPIKGKGGVYVLQRTSDVASVESQDNYTTDRETIMTSNKSRAPFSLYNAFRESADVIDLRFERR